MKILFKTILLVFLFSNYLNAQPFESSKSTTEEEYNYMLKGYKSAMEQGLDLKKGYETKETSEIKSSGGDYTFYFTILKRTSDDSYAGIMVKAVSHSWDNTYWYAIPFNNYDLFDNFLTSVAKLDAPMTRAFFKVFLTYNLSKEPALPTTDIEYNYMAKGYKAQVEQGLDMKKGYAFKDDKNLKYLVSSVNYYEFEFMPLYRSAKSQCGTVVKLFSANSGETSYIGIPNYIFGSVGQLADFINSMDENYTTAFFGAYVYYALGYQSNSPEVE